MNVHVDILVCIPRHILKEDTMERINLNVSVATRKRLKAIAKLRSKTEAETAREMLEDAIDQAEREEFYRQVALHATPERLAREMQIFEAFEELDRR